MVILICGVPTEYNYTPGAAGNKFLIISVIRWSFIFLIISVCIIYIILYYYIILLYLKGWRSELTRANWGWRGTWRVTDSREKAIERAPRGRRGGVVNGGSLSSPPSTAIPNYGDPREIFITNDRDRRIADVGCEDGDDARGCTVRLISVSAECVMVINGDNSER